LRLFLGEQAAFFYWLLRGPPFWVPCLTFIFVIFSSFPADSDWHFPSSSFLTPSPFRLSPFLLAGRGRAFFLIVYSVCSLARAVWPLFLSPHTGSRFLRLFLSPFPLLSFGWAFPSRYDRPSFGVYRVVLLPSFSSRFLPSPFPSDGSLSIFCLLCPSRAPCPLVSDHSPLFLLSVKVAPSFFSSPFLTSFFLFFPSSPVFAEP